MDWSSFREQFPVTRNWAFLDHAAVAPLPNPAIAALQEYAQNLGEHGIASIIHWVELVKHVRQQAARLVNSPSPDDICFVPNTTVGIGLIAEGFPWQPGDNVVLPGEEYPSNQYPWLNLQARGVEVRKVPSRGNRIHLDDIRAAITSKTRLLSISAVEFASGFRNNLDDLGAICKQHGIFFFVDAIQALGAFPVDVQRSGIDALAADGHKWMLSPEGAGFAYIRREWVERLHPIGIGAHSVINPFEYHVIDFQMKPHAGRWEGGALNIPGIAALGGSLDLLLDAGINAISTRLLELTDHLCESAKRVGIAVFSSRLTDDRSGIVSMELPGQERGVILKRCRNAGIIVNHRAGRLRVSPHAYNTFDELDRLIDVLKS